MTNREIKFRVYNTETKKLSHGFSIQSLAEEMCYPVIESHIDNRIWQQYTGIIDKDGVEIYEGDLITGHRLPIGNTPAEVIFNERYGQWQVDGKHCGGALISILHSTETKYRVIGNIFEGIKNETN